LNRTITTARLSLRPVGGADLSHLIRLKADPLVFAQMLGGIRAPWQVMQELAEDIAFWARWNTGMFAIYHRATFVGTTGIHERCDGMGLALRFAVWGDARGRGLAREAASAALRQAHDQAGIARVIAVARADNFASRSVLGSIGMVERDAFVRDGHIMIVMESRAARKEACSFSEEKEPIL
jgi:RimJ/RimL family protein N-acetyltransferase